LLYHSPPTLFEKSREMFLEKNVTFIFEEDNVFKSYFPTFYNQQKQKLKRLYNGVLLELEKYEKHKEEIK
jgi:hypothetical protein